MPETSMDENNGLILRKDDVRLAGEIVSVKPKPVSEPVKEAADDFFGLCVLAPDPRHNSASCLGAEDVGHLRNFRTSSCTQRQPMRASVERHYGLPSNFNLRLVEGERVEKVLESGGVSVRRRPVLRRTKITASLV